MRYIAVYKLRWRIEIRLDAVIFRWEYFERVGFGIQRCWEVRIQGIKSFFFIEIFFLFWNVGELFFFVLYMFLYDGDFIYFGFMVF